VMRRSVMVIDDEESGAWSGMLNLDSENINQMVLGMIEWSEQLSSDSYRSYSL
jgi:redox-regulated HSP33 family molecular chaperone